MKNKHLKRLLGGFGLLIVVSLIVGAVHLLAYLSKWIYYNQPWIFGIVAIPIICYIVGSILHMENDF